jgi:hypothetical protein
MIGVEALLTNILRRAWRITDLILWVFILNWQLIIQFKILESLEIS